MKSFLPKKALVTFLFSKLAFLIFGIILTASFFYFLTVQKDIQAFDKMARTSESIIDITATVSASPFPVNVTYEPDFKGNITINNSSFTLSSGGKNLTTAFCYPINQTGTININSCLQISKTNQTVISECQ
jgi:hypothetical protein